MAEVNLPLRVVRSQIFSAVDIVVQLERMRDGVRRVTGIFQIDSFDNDDITIKPLWQYHFRGIANDGKLIGEFVSDATVPRFLHRLEYYGLADRFMEALAEDRPS